MKKALAILLSVLLLCGMLPLGAIFVAAEESVLVTDPEVGVAYKFGMVQGNVSADTVYYLKGGMSGYYMATSSIVTEAIDVYLEDAYNGYYMYAMIGSQKKYINMVVSGTHVNGAYADIAQTTYHYDMDAATVIAVVNGEEYWFGTRNDMTYTTVGPVNVAYNGFCCQFYLPTGDAPEIPDDEPEADTELTIAEAIALGMSKEHNTYTVGKYYVTGVITEVYNTQYGNMYLTDDEGNILTLYGTWSADGMTRYDALDVRPVAGETITIYGVVGQYNGAPQVKNGWIVDHVKILPTIEAGVDTIVNITYGGERVDFLFTPTKSGLYTFGAYGDEDTYGYILDAEGNQLEEDDDGGNENQFLMEYYFEAGTSYILRARFYYSWNTGSFPVCVIHLRDGLQYRVEDGEATITGYRGEIPADLEIPDTIDGYPVTAIGNRAFSSCYELRTVIIPEGVTYIGSSAFRYCDNLQSIYVPTSVMNVEDEAFASCYSLRNVYYAGDEEQRWNISVWGYNDRWYEATWHYNFTGCLHSYDDILDPDCNKCGEEREIAYIEEGVDTIVNIENGGQRVDFVFIPEVSGLYSFGSYGNYDTYGYILYANGTTLQFDDDSGEDNQFRMYCVLEAGTVYVLRSRYYDEERTGSFPIRVDYLPVAHVVIEDEEFIENTGGYEEWFGYYYTLDSLEVVLVYTDGTTERMIIDDYSTNAWELQVAEPWALGGTYTVTVELLGTTATVNVSIVENPIARIEVEDIVYIEGGGEWNSDWDEETGEEVRWMWYSHTPYNITLYFKDGTSKTYYDRWEIDEDLGVWLNYTSDQSYENQWGMGEHTATIGYGDRQWEYTVRIIENPIASIAVEDVEMIEHSNGHWEGYYDEDDNWVNEAWFYYYAPDPRQVTVTLTDGTVYSGEWNEVREQLYDLMGDDVYNDNRYAEQSYENPWIIGENTAILEWLGKEIEYTVIVTEHPVASVVFDPITYYEYTGGSWSGYWDENDNHIAGAYYDYDINPQYVTVTMRDGSVYSGEFYDVREQLEDILEDVWGMGYNSGQSYETPWGIGEHTVMVEWINIYSEITITIVESPVVGVEVAPVTFYEGTNGDFYDGWYEYYVYGEDLAVTATLADGTVLSGWDGIADALGAGADYTCIMDQSKENPWGVGTHTATVKTLGFEVEVPVTILPSPVAALALKDLVLYQGIDSYEEWEGWDYYSVSPELTGVLLKDGTLAELVNSSAIRYDGVTYYLEDNAWDMQNAESWTAGNTYTVEAYLMGVTATFNVTIAENPIASIEVTDMPDSIVVMQGGSLNLKGATFRIHYVDGAYEDITIDKDYLGGYYSRFYLEKIDRIACFYVNLESVVTGVQVASVSLCNRSCEIPVLVKDNTIESISIREQEDNTVIITVNHPNGTSYDMSVMGVSICWYLDGPGTYYAPLITDMGAWECYVFATHEGCYIKLYDEVSDKSFTSNVIESDWLRMVPEFCARYGYSIYFDYVAPYGGVLTEENIDRIISVVAQKHQNEGVQYKGDTIVASGENLRRWIMELLALDSVDLTLSQYYDAATDTYSGPNAIRGLGMQEVGAYDISYDNGVWTIHSLTYDWETGDRSIPVYAAVDDQLRFIAFYVGEIPETPDEPVEPDQPENIPGDANGDGAVNNRDLALVQQYINKWDVEIDLVAADVNDDGAVNNRDLALMQQYINKWDVELK